MSLANKTPRGMSLANKSQHYRKVSSMTELALESITKVKCLECGDKLTEWETSGYCIMCEPDEYEVY